MNRDTAIAVLKSQGYDTSQLELEASLRDFYEQFSTPDDTELTYAKFRTPAVRDREPNTQHKWWEKVKRDVLGCDTLWENNIVDLTSGQRSILRDKFGMTPTSQVEIVGVEFYSKPHEVYIKAVTIRSLAPAESRKHILSLVRIPKFGHFLEAAFNLDSRVHTAQESETTTTKSQQKQQERLLREEELMKKYA